MSNKLNYPLLGLLVQVPLTLLLAALRLTGLLEISWLAVVGLPILAGAASIVAGLLEHVQAHKQPLERSRIKSRPIL